MTKSKRWPNHAEWARMESIGRMQRITQLCQRLRRVLPNESMKMTVLEIQLSAQETITALTNAKDPNATPEPGD